MLLFDDFALEPEPVFAPVAALPDPDPAELPRPAGEVIRIVRPLPAKTRGVLITLRGNATSAAMILRTGTMRPGQGYRAVLNVTAHWQTVNLLLSDFSPVGGVLRKHPRPSALRSYAVLPQGGQISLTRVRFY
jgi:hypothetical protein